MLLEKMLEKPDTAKGVSKENKEKLPDFWKQLTLSLNSLGPSVKSEFEWKKCRMTRNAVRKKASQNKMYERGAGGGPKKTQTLSSAEEAIYHLLDLKDSFEGLLRSKLNSEIEILSDILVRSDDNPGCSTDFLQLSLMSNLSLHNVSLLLHQMNANTVIAAYSRFCVQKSIKHRVDFERT